MKSPSIAEPKEPRGHPNNREDQKRTAYHQTDKHADAEGIPGIELWCEWRTESTARLGVAANITGGNVVPG